LSQHEGHEQPSTSVVSRRHGCVAWAGSAPSVRAPPGGGSRGHRAMISYYIVVDRGARKLLREGIEPAHLPASFLVSTNPRVDSHLDELAEQLRAAPRLRRQPAAQRRRTRRHARRRPGARRPGGGDHGSDARRVARRLRVGVRRHATAAEGAEAKRQAERPRRLVCRVVPRWALAAGARWPRSKEANLIAPLATIGVPRTWRPARTCTWRPARTCRGAGGLAAGALRA